MEPMSKIGRARSSKYLLRGLFLRVRSENIHNEIYSRMEYTDGFTFQFAKTGKFLSEKLLTLKYDTLYNFCYSNKSKCFFMPKLL